MLASVGELKRHLHTAGTVTAGATTQANEDLLLELLQAASSRLAEELPGRTLEADPPLENTGTDEAPVWEDTSDPVERRRSARSTIQVPDLRELVELRVEGRDPIDVADYRLVRRRPDWPAIYLKVRRSLWLDDDDELVIVGRWGPAESNDLTPSDSVRHAALVWAARAFQARTARYSDTVATPDGGVQSYFRQMPPDVQATVNALTIPGV